MITLELPDSRKPATLSWQHFAVLLIDKYKLGSVSKSNRYSQAFTDSRRVGRALVELFIVSSPRIQRESTRIAARRSSFSRLRLRRYVSWALLLPSLHSLFVYRPAH